ncbi:DUF2608 domain-containing protein [Candidatus Dependentiae bacterium]|nr:DUF2608 domain-containing protein [Candidatus Dependentiae bacterium]
MVKKILLLVAGLILLCPGFFYFSRDNKTVEPCKYPQIHTFAEARESLAMADELTFVFSDCDDTLISSSDYLPAKFSIPTSLTLLLLLKNPRLLWDKKYGESVYSMMLERAPKMLVDPEAAGFFKMLRQQGAHFLAITGMETGSFGLIQSMPAWRAGVLKNFGVPLHNGFENTVFDSLPSYRGNYPELFEGLICCNRMSKGMVIGAFLDCFKLKPMTVVLFDDSHEELESLEVECQKRGIEALCYHFKGASKIQYKPWSIWRAFRQIEHLMKHHEWLSDAVA